MAKRDRWMNPPGLLCQESAESEAETAVIWTSRLACLSTSECNALQPQDLALGPLMNEPDGLGGIK